MSAEKPSKIMIGLPGIFRQMIPAEPKPKKVAAQKPKKKKERKK